MKIYPIWITHDQKENGIAYKKDKGRRLQVSASLW
jgi:hypothetical protein